MVRESKIIIAQGIKLDNDYKNVLSYTQQQMLDLVNSNDHKLAIATDYSFIRQEKNMVQVGFPYSTVCNANYMAFQNKDYNNRWFFAFIRDVEYVNDKTVNIIFDIDVWSTFYGDLSIMKCFVEREHVNDDTIGLHTVPENISTGDMVCVREESDAAISSDLLDYWIGVYTDWQPLDSGTWAWTKKAGYQFDGITAYNRNITGHTLVLFKLKRRESGTIDWTTHVPDLTDLQDFIATCNIDGHIEDLKDIFILPNVMFESGEYNERVVTRDVPDAQPIFLRTFKYYIPKQSLEIKSYAKTIPKIHSFDGINIANNKCYCYPYNYLLVSNNQGSQNIYKYEFFSDPDNATFKTELSASIGCSGRTIPKNYLGVVDNIDESIGLGKFPTCGWTADSFTNYLTEQAINLPQKMIGTSAGIGMATAIYGPLGGLIASAGNVIGALGQFYPESLKPNIEGSGNTADVVYGSNDNTFTYKCMRSKKEDIEIVDKYFTRYGYKINETKTPNLTGRTYWNYIKIGGNDRFASGNVQTKFLDIINEIAQKGVTIWHSHANIGNFDLDNSIVE